MKKVKLLSLLFAAAIFFGCGLSDQSILKKYETHSPVELAANKGGIGLELTTDSTGELRFRVPCSHPALNLNRENVDLLSERLFVVNAENPTEQLDAVSIITTQEDAGKDSTKTGYFSTIVFTEKTPAKYVLVCFKGIDKNEFERAETPPCFFIVSLDKAKPHVLTEAPLLAGNLVTADSTKGKFIRFTEPQIYSGIIPFEKSKNVELKFTLSADAAQVTEMNLTTEELYLFPENYVENNDSKSKLEFNVTKDFSVNSSFALRKINGVNVIAVDANGNYIIDNTIVKGGLEATTPVETLDNKIVLDDVITCDLSITDACIYGTVKIAIHSCATKQEYAVFRNITTPQEVPGNILEPLDK
ncbi:MAG: hypothetical protein LBE04_00265 [Prevotellaceae bacterium]|nr:hypothetical protein [Prevotellaceae bacterium]